MNYGVIILCKDKIFSRMIEIELKKAGCLIMPKNSTEEGFIVYIDAVYFRIAVNILVFVHYINGPFYHPEGFDRDCKEQCERQKQQYLAFMEYKAVTAEQEQIIKDVFSFHQ